MATSFLTSTSFSFFYNIFLFFTTFILLLSFVAEASALRRCRLGFDCGTNPPVCLPWIRVCDRRHDCPDSRDEIDCSKFLQCGFQNPSDLVPEMGKAHSGEYPWIAKILSYDFANSTGGIHCAASLISDQWLLTSADCFYETKGHIKQFQRVNVSLGEEPVKGNFEIEVEAAEIHIHPDFNDGNYDFALIKLPKPLNFTSSLHPICLPDRCDNDENMDMEFKAEIDDCFDRSEISGWVLKHFQNNEISNILTKGTVRLVSRKTCNIERRYENLPKTKICSETATASCTGLAGASMMCRRRDNRMFLLGVSSWGETTCVDQFPTFNRFLI